MAFRPSAFPIKEKFKRWHTCAPSLLGFHTGLVPTSRYGILPALRLDAHLEPPSAQSPFARSTVLPPPEWCQCTLGRTLLLRHRSYELMRQTTPLLTLSAQLYVSGLCRLLPVPAAKWPFPTLSLQVLPEMPRPLPRRFAGCTCLLLPLQHRPSPASHGSAYRMIPLKRLRSGGLFRGCSHSLMFKPLSLLATLVAPTITVSCVADSGFYVRALHASLPPHASNMLAVRTSN